MNPTLTVIGSTPPITLAQAKSAKKIISDGENDALQRMLDTAVAVVEYGTGRALRLNTYVLRLDSFSDSRYVIDGVIRIPMSPLVTVTAIKYYNTASTPVEQTLSDSVYEVDIYREPGEVSLKSRQSWPSINMQKNAVSIEFTAGYANSGTLDKPPHVCVQAVELVFGEYFVNREDYAGRRLPKASEVLINKAKVVG